jgi:hypothetical protein
MPLLASGSYMSLAKNLGGRVWVKDNFYRGEGQIFFKFTADL